MPRFVPALVILTLTLGSCSASTTSDPIASLESTTTTAPDDQIVATEGDPLLAFAACMRENGIADFEDPIVRADGKVEFPDTASGKDDDAYAGAFDACGSLLEGTAFGTESKGSDVEGLDELYDFAVCMRDQGFDIDDPDPETGSLGDLDKDDPDFTAAYEACATTLGTPKDR